MADFQASWKTFKSEQIKLVAASVDPTEKTRELVDKLRIGYPVAYGLDAQNTSKKTGGFFDEKEKFLQPTGILVRPDAAVEIAVFSTGPIGRFVAEDVLKMVRYYKKRN